MVKILSLLLRQVRICCRIHPNSTPTLYMCVYIISSRLLLSISDCRGCHLVIVTSCRIFGQATRSTRKQTNDSRDEWIRVNGIGIRIRLGIGMETTLEWLLVSTGGGWAHPPFVSGYAVTRTEDSGPRLRPRLYQMSLVYSCLISILGPRECCDR